MFQILAIFLVLVLGFTVAFMVQFNQEQPFKGLGAIVKTIVMMTSEFDYSDTFKDDSGTLVFFIVFLIFIPIVLLNLMVGVAVNDIKDLKALGDFNRLAKNAAFLRTLDIRNYNAIISIFPTKLSKFITIKGLVKDEFTIKPGDPKQKPSLPPKLLDAILKIAEDQDIK